MDEDDQTQAFCGECGNSIAVELIEIALKGKKVYCENCGTPFKPKIKQKEIEPPKSYEPPPKAEPFKQIKSNIAKQLKFQEEFRSKITKKLKTKYDRYFKPEFESVNEPTGRIPKQDQPPKAPTPPITPTPRKTPAQPIRPHITKTKVIIPEKSLKNLKKGINFLNNIVNSPLILILGIIATVGQIVNMFLTQKFLPSVASGIFFRFIVLIIINGYVQKKITPRIYSRDYSKLGIDALIMGSIASACYGLGVFIFIEGVLILVYEIFVKLNTLQTHKGKTLPTELSHEILTSNIIEDVISVMNENLYKAESFIILLGIPLMINEINFFSNLTWMFLAFFIVALVMLNFVKTTVNPTLKSTPYTKLEEGFIVKSLILGGLSLVFGGSGIILLIMSILLFVYRDRFAAINKKVANYQPKAKPTVTEHQPEITPVTAKKEESPVEPKTSEVIRRETKEIEQKKLIPLPSYQAEKQDPDNKKALQKIPEIQKKVKAEKGIKADKDSDRIEKQKSKDKKEIPQQDFQRDPERQEKIDFYLDRLFTVISEETRERLLKLDIPEDEKWDVVREFVNLKEEHRQKYIEELENVNRKISGKLISRVMVMKIDDAKKEGLINSLKLMTPNNQQEFVEYLESNE